MQHGCSPNLSSVEKRTKWNINLKTFFALCIIFPSFIHLIVFSWNEDFDVYMLICWIVRKWWALSIPHVCKNTQALGNIHAAYRWGGGRGLESTLSSRIQNLVTCQQGQSLWPHLPTLSFLQFLQDFIWEMHFDCLYWFYTQMSPFQIGTRLF